MRTATARLARQDKATTGRQVRLHVAHTAVLNQRTLFPKTVRDPLSETVLKSGYNNRKIGKAVTKGKWAGMPIYTLTLEERATCPTSCLNWQDCYGNKMPFARRFLPGPGLHQQLFRDLSNLQRKHPDGFVVRLHVLGDFYNTTYAYRWQSWLREFPALHVFGFTARMPNTKIGAVLTRVRDEFPDRWWVRRSDGPGWLSTATITGDVPEGTVVCPYETGKTQTCGTCGLCWTATKRIGFLKQ